MEIKELLALKEELLKTYNEEKATVDSLNEKEKNIILDELNDIEKEQSKIDKLIKIYQSDDKNYIVMNLEKLYMMLLSGLNQKEFDNLNEDEIFQLFDKLFPDEWAFSYALDKKEVLLLNAIAENREIAVLKNKKRLYNIDDGE